MQNAFYSASLNLSNSSKNNFMDKIKEILISKQAKRFYWQIGNGFVGIALLVVAGGDWVYAPIIIAILNGISKEANNYLSR